MKWVDRFIEHDDDIFGSVFISCCSSVMPGASAYFRCRVWDRLSDSCFKVLTLTSNDSGTRFLYNGRDALKRQSDLPQPQAFEGHQERIKSLP
jgi:hypothetical protein